MTVVNTLEMKSTEVQTQGRIRAETPPLLGYHLKNDVKSGRST